MAKRKRSVLERLDKAKAMFVVIAGLGTLQGSSMAKVVPAYQSAFPGQPVWYKLWKDIEKNPLDFADLPEDVPIVYDGHSLGGYAIVLSAAENARRRNPVIAIFRDPVTGDVKHFFSQVGAPPLSLPPNIVSARCYLRDTAVMWPPFHQPLAHTDGLAFVNKVVPGSDHSSLVGLIQDEVMAFVKSVVNPFVLVSSKSSKGRLSCANVFSQRRHLSRVCS